MLKPTIGRRALLQIGSLPLILLVVAVGACQTYNFEPFTPSFYKQYVQVVNGYAITVKPNVMIAFDTSGSMDDTSCPGCGKKIDIAKNAMVTFLNDAGTRARFGLTFFPDTKADSQCGAPTKITVNLPDAGNSIGAPPTDVNTDAGLQEISDQIIKQIQGINSPDPKILTVATGGGTPTQTTFSFLADYQGLSGADGRQNYILLVTDGLPNCNPTNPNNVCSYATESWRSTYSKGRPPQSETDSTKIAAFEEINAALDKCNCQNGAPLDCLYSPTSSPPCSLGCLNLVGTAAEISRIRTVKLIKTIVVGFSTAANTEVGKQGLSAMARAGGFPRACPKGTDAECGAGDTCDTQISVCRRPYYQVTTGTELVDALQSIIRGLPEPCDFQLVAAPSDPSLLAVIVNGTVIPPGPDTWKYTAGKVSFPTGTKICTDILNATNFKSVKIEFRILQQIK